MAPDALRDYPPATSGEELNEQISERLGQVFPKNLSQSCRGRCRRHRLDPAPAVGQSSLAGASAFGGAGTASTKINPEFMITPQQAWEWHLFKAQAGPTYAGSAGWKRFTDFLIAKIPEFGGVDIDSVDIPTTTTSSTTGRIGGRTSTTPGVAVEKLVTDGTPVPVVASYGMTSGSTPPEGITAPMIFYDPAHHRPTADIAGKILVFQTAPQPAPPYTNSFLDNYTLTRLRMAFARQVGAALHAATDQRHQRSYYTAGCGVSSGGFAAIGLKARAAGIVVVYDLSPGAAFGLTQRSVYTADGRAGVGARATSTVRHSHSIA